MLQRFGTAEEDAYRRDLTINRYYIFLAFNSFGSLISLYKYFGQTGFDHYCFLTACFTTLTVVL